MAYTDDEEDDDYTAQAVADAPPSEARGALGMDGRKALAGALERQQAVTTRQQSAYDELQRQRRLEVAQQRQILDQTITKMMMARQSDKVAPWLAIAAGLLSPTRTGRFGEEFGNAARNLAPVLAKRDADRLALEQGVGQLRFQSAGLESGVMREEQQDLVRQMLESQRSAGRMATALGRVPPMGQFQQVMHSLGILPGDPRYKVYGEAYLKKSTERAPGRMYQYPDASSETGYRYGTADDVIGKSAMGPSGTVIETDPATGKLSAVRMGPGVGKPGTAPGLTTTTTTRVEKEAIDAGGQLMKLDTIEQKFDPKFHEYGEQIRNWGRGKAEKLGVRLSPEHKKALGDYAAYVRDTGAVMAEIRHELFGATLTKGEQASADKFIVSEDDSPTSAEAKIKGFKEMARKSVARMAYIKQHGLKMEDIPLEKMPSIIRARGNQLERDLIEQGLEGDQLKAAIKSRLGQEFGLGG